jgi:hypothetical protein
MVMQDTNKGKYRGKLQQKLTPMAEELQTGIAN